MLLEDGERRTRGWKTLKCCSQMAKRELVVTKPLKCRHKIAKRELVRTLTSPTQPRVYFQPFCEPAFLAPHYPRPPSAPSFIKSRTLRILPTHFFLFWNSLYVYTRGILGCLLGLWPLGQNPAGGNKCVLMCAFHIRCCARGISWLLATSSWMKLSPELLTIGCWLCI